jgi:hypothetical protein
LDQFQSIVKRKERIPVRVTPNEKDVIHSRAQAIGTNVSRMLRLLGLRATELHQLIILVRRVTSRLMRLKSLSYRRQIHPNEIQSAIDSILEHLQQVENALQPPQIDPPDASDTAP